MEGAELNRIATRVANGQATSQQTARLNATQRELSMAQDMGESLTDSQRRLLRRLDESGRDPFFAPDPGVTTSTNSIHPIVPTFDEVPNVGSRGLTNAEVQLFSAHGVDAENIPHIISFRPSATMDWETAVGLGMTFRPNAASLALRRELDTAARAVITGNNTSDLATVLSRQTLEMLRDPNLIVRLNRNLSDIGSGRWLDETAGTFLIDLNPSRFGNPALGVTWHPFAIVVHETGHMAQQIVQKEIQVIIGRSIREFDSTMRMSVVQNAIHELDPLVQALTPSQALRAALIYSTQVQLNSFKVLSDSAPRMLDANRFFDGLFQMDHVATIARTQAYFPNFSERDILAQFISIHRRNLANLDPDIKLHPLYDSLRFSERYDNMIQEAEAALQAL